MPSRMLEVVAPSHSPCRHFVGVCDSMRWSPAEGHVPRGMCGATGDLSEIELVLVSAEPGDPLRGESYEVADIAATVAFSVECLRRPATPFHKNTRVIMDLCFPGCSLDEQLRRVWRTNSVLCSARIECGSVAAEVVSTCIAEYLARQLSLVPHAVVAALGSKAHRRLRRAGFSAFPALHPSSRESSEAKLASWRALAERVAASRTNGLAARHRSQPSGGSGGT